jgi:murein L,D-transpeptidase YafK
MLRSSRSLSLWLPGACLGLASAVAAPAAELLASVTTGGTYAAANGPYAPAPVSAELPMAERVVVYKSRRQMLLLRRGAVLRTYRVSLGLQPSGPKERSGDFRTPEGSYRLTRRNTRSDFFLSVQVSYPNDEDMRSARRNRWQAGGSIMVHGLPNAPRHPLGAYAGQDWTDGCIALSNSDMVEFWLMTQPNVPIDILP